MRRRKIILVLAWCLVSAGCSRRDSLSRPLAADLISDSDSFKAMQRFFLRTGVVSNKDYLSPEYLVLQRRGWITGMTVPCTAEIAPPPCWDVALTPIGVEIFHGLIPAETASKQYFPIPTARRQLLEVTGISYNGNVADVDFTWKWVPINEVGGALAAGGVNYKSTVGFKRYDDGWRVIEGSAVKSNQGLDEALKDAQPTP